MKNASTFYILIFLLIISITSCSDDEVSPKPVSQPVFTQDYKVIEVNETVKFTNYSINATRYEWDFGNGQTSTSKNASATYTNTGNYTVKLTSYNSENVASTTSSVVKVGERFLTKIVINTLNYNNLSGETWDLNDGPDLRFNLRKSSNTTSWDSAFNFGNDYTQAMLPKSLILQTPIKLTNEKWDFQLEDIDSPDPNDDMATWTGNPITIGMKDPATGLGYLGLKSIYTDKQVLDIQLFFEVK